MKMFAFVLAEEGQLMSVAVLTRPDFRTTVRNESVVQTENELASEAVKMSI